MRKWRQPQARHSSPRFSSGFGFSCIGFVIAATLSGRRRALRACLSVRHADPCRGEWPPGSTRRRRSPRGRRASGCPAPPDGAATRPPRARAPPSSRGIRSSSARPAAVRLRIAAEERQATLVPHRHGQPRVDEALPGIRVEKRVPDGAASLDVRDAPVEADRAAGPLGVLVERAARRGHEPPVARQEHRRVLQRLAAAGQEERKSFWERQLRLDFQCYTV